MSIVIHTDGGSRSNPGHAGIGAVIERDGKKLFEISEYIGECTNNVAEYTAVIRALETCIAHNLTAEPLTCKIDSKLVVEQVQNRWKIKEPSLIPLVTRVRALSAHFPSVTYVHIPREQNTEADRLVNDAIDRAGW